MALVLNDRVKETTITTGTGTLNLAGAATNFETFVAGIGDGNTVYYAIVHQNQAEFEVGLGTVTDASPDTLSRTTILSSSNNDGLVSFSAGTKDVFCTLPASKTVFEDASSNVTLPGTLDVDGGITVDNITIDGTEIDLSSGDLTIDVAGDIILDADGGDINLKDGGSEFAAFINSSLDFVIRSTSSDRNLHIQGNDGGSIIDALTFDMSEAGAATFNSTVTANAGVVVDNITIDGTEIDLSSGDLTIDAAGRIDLSADDNGEIRLFDGSSMYAQFKDDSDRLSIQALISDADMLFVGNDGGSTITALQLDMSEAGAATFNNNVTAFSDKRLKDNIETLEDGLTKVEQLRGVTYTRDGKENIGVIAQEIEKILPEIVLTADDEMGTKSVDYSRITAVLIEAVKELSVRVKELENK